MTPILHSVSYAGAWPGQTRLTLDQFIGKAADLGFPAVMLMAKRPHLSPLDFPPEECRRLREALDARAIECRVIAGYTNFGADLEHGEIPQRELQIQHVAELARMARDLGAPIVRVFTSYEHASVSYSQLWRITVDALKECARRAAAYGVTIGVQNHHDLAADHRSLGDLLADVDEPNCRACFDAWSPALHGTDILAAAREMASLTCHTTVADYQRRPRFRYLPEFVNYEARAAWIQAVPMGEGFIDYRGFIAALREGGYTGGIAYEMCSPLLGGGGERNLDRYARQFLDFAAQMAQA
ncbi:MAG: sugar phosphate isomerase/epimerase [Bryobacteraceae bacterium]|nr:sugar phosphate isomerase/epimerase [Bryobacteraceae bacterium]